MLLGVVERESALVSVRLSDQELATWTYDDTAQSLGEYAQPSLSFEMSVEAVRLPLRACT